MLAFLSNEENEFLVERKSLVVIREEMISSKGIEN